jgi:hypothetical protein
MYLLVDVTIDYTKGPFKENCATQIKLKSDKKTIEGPSARQFLSNPGRLIQNLKNLKEYIV